MVNGIGAGGAGAGKSLLHAELERMKQRAADLRGEATGTDPAKAFAQTVSQEMQALDQTVKTSDKLHIDAVEGNLDFHEVAARLKEAQLSFDFAMQVRNKLIDAYREVMRMSI